MADMSDTTQPPATLGDSYAVLSRKKGWILIGALVLAGLAYAYTATSVPKWKARMTLLFPLSDGTSTLLRLTGTNPAAPMLMAAGVINSQPALERIASETGLSEEYITDILSTSTEPDTNKLIIAATHRDKAKALAVVKSAYGALEGISRDLGFSVATRQAKELEKALNAKKRQMEESAERLRLFQETAKTVADPSTPFGAASYLAKAKELEMELQGVRREIAIARDRATRVAKSPNTISAAQPKIAEWRKTLRDLEYTLSLLQIKYGDAAPAVKEHKQKIEVTRKQLQNEISAYLMTVYQNTDDTLAELTAKELLLSFQLDLAKDFARVAPREAMSLQKLRTEFEVNEAAFKEITAKYEAARVEAEVEKVRWGVLEQPFIEPQPTNKKFVRNTGLGFFGGAVITAFLILQAEARRQRRRKPDAF